MLDWCLLEQSTFDVLPFLFRLMERLFGYKCNSLVGLSGGEIDIHLLITALNKTFDVH
jgi:hypothetical protein